VRLFSQVTAQNVPHNAAILSVFCPCWIWREISFPVLAGGNRVTSEGSRYCGADAIALSVP